ncbi:hypothetical protein J4407_00555 [Candidatus Pacearchaeota archaeon]|nr:hypothetical protein [Candidatus Pacearchaeota archaeon]
MGESLETNLRDPTETVLSRAKEKRKVYLNGTDYSTSPSSPVSPPTPYSPPSPPDSYDTRDS